MKEFFAWKPYRIILLRLSKFCGLRLQSLLTQVVGLLSKYMFHSPFLVELKITTTVIIIMITCNFVMNSNSLSWLKKRFKELGLQQRGHQYCLENVKSLMKVRIK